MLKNKISDKLLEQVDGSARLIEQERRQHLQTAVKRADKVRMHAHSEQYKQDNQLCYANNLLPYMTGQYIQSLLAGKDCMVTVMEGVRPVCL